LSKQLTIVVFFFLGLSACARQDATVSIPFTANFGGQQVGCERPQDLFQMTDLRFYVYQPTLHRDDGTSVSIELNENGRWQHDELVLIDLEDGSGDCRNGTPDANNLITGKVPAGDYQSLTFSIGVPFERNHADPLTALIPLDDSTMHWHWRSGYKFLRAGFSTANDGFWIHLGSAGCKGTVRNIESCRFSNRFDVALDDFQLGDEIAVDFSALLSTSSSMDGMQSDCSSGPAEESCREPFAVFGIDFDTGEQVSEQKMFFVGQR